MATAQPLGQMIIELGLDSSTFASGMKGATQQVRTAMTEMKAHLNIMSRSGEEIDKLKARQTGLTSVVEAQTRKVSEAGKEYEACRKEVEGNENATQAQKDALIKTQKEYVKAIGELGSYENQLKEVNIKIAAMESSLYKAGTALEGVGKKLTGVGDKMTSVGKALTVGVTAPLAALGFGATKAAMEWESAFAGVQKTVDEVVDSNGNVVYSYEQIEDSLLSMAERIPATTTEIAAVAEAAGQLGIATEDVTYFTEVMLNLGESTNLSAEEAASSLAKFTNITKTSSSEYENLGSSIVALGNNFATTEADIVSMSTRLASAGTLAGLSETEILGLATAMSSVGIEAEAGGTAMTQTLTAIESAVVKGGKSLNQFAEVAGMSADDFSATWENEPIIAIQAFISGLGKLDEQGESATLVLDEMGLSGVRQSNMLKSLALSAENLGAAVEMSGTAWEENTALTEEAEKRYGTTESQMTLLKNKVNNVAIELGGPLLASVNSAIEAAQPLINSIKGIAESFANASPETQQMIVKIGLVAVAMGPVLTIAGKLTSGIGKLTSGIGKNMKKFAEWAARITHTTVATKAQDAATDASTAATKLNTTATGKNTAGLLANTAKKLASTVADKAQVAVEKAKTIALMAGNGVLATQATELNKSLGIKIKDTAHTIAHTVAEKARSIVTGVSTIATGAQTVAITAQTTAISICTVAVGFLEAAFKLLLGPVGLLIVAGAALVTGVVKLVEWLTKESDEVKKLKAETEELVETNGQLVDSLDTSEEAYKSNETALQSEIGAAKTLTDKIKELSAVENKTAEQKRELASYVDMLNSSVEDLNLSYDEESDALNMTTDAIYEKIDAYELQAKKQAAQDRYTEILKEQIEVEEQLKITEDKLTEATELNTSWFGMKSSTMKDLEEQQAILIERQADLAASEGYVTGVIEEATAAEVERAAATQQTAEVQAQAAADQVQAVHDSMPTILEAYGTLKNAYQDMGEEQKAAIDGVLESYQMLTSSLSNLTKQIELDQETSWASIQQNQADTIAKTQEFSTLYSQLIEAGISESYLNAIGATGPESIPLLQDMLNQGTDTVLQSQAEWESAYGVIGDTLTTSLGLEGEAKAALQDYVLGEAGILGTLKSAIETADLNSLGCSVTEGFGKGILDNIDNADDATKAMVDSLTGETKELLGINSPSKVFEEMGLGVIEGFVLGIDESQGSLTASIRTAMESAARIAKETMESAMGQVSSVTSASFDELPKAAQSGMSGVNSAVTSGMSSVKATVISNMNSIGSTVKSSLLSIKTQFTAGFSDIASTVTSKMASIAEAVTNGQNKIKSNTTAWMIGMQSSVSSGINAIVMLANSGASRTVSAFNIYNPMYSSGVSAMDGFYSGLSAREASVYAKARGIANNVAQTIKSALDIHSPSRVLMELGEFTMEGFGIGLENMQSYVSGIAEDTADSVASGFNNLPQISPQLITDQTPAIKSMANALRQLKQTNDSPDIRHSKANEKSDHMLETIIHLLAELLQRDPEYNIVLDDGTLVGRLGNKIDRKLSRISKRKERG